MNNQEIKKILTAHGIDSYNENGQLYAITIYTKNGQTYEEPENVTGYSKKQILEYLGY